MESKKSDKNVDLSISIPVTTIYKPTYTHAFYKLPEAPVDYWKTLDIHVGRCLGEGTFACTYEGTYGPKAQLPSGKEKYLNSAFAVKVHHIGYHPYVPGAPNKDRIDDETQNEINFAKRTDISHPNIIEFHFTAEYPPKYESVCDHVFIFMAKAMFPLQELLNCLTKMRAHLPINVGLKWLRGIASGLLHIHNIGIVHNDLSSFNVLVFGNSDQQIGNDFRFKNIELKIADFGKCVDISKDSNEEKVSKKRKDIENLCLLSISLCAKIAFDEETRKQSIDRFHQCFQKNISLEETFNTKILLPSSEVEDWTIFITQLV